MSRIVRPGPRPSCGWRAGRWGGIRPQWGVDPRASQASYTQNCQPGVAGARMGPVPSPQGATTLAAVRATWGEGCSATTWGSTS